MEILIIISMIIVAIVVIVFTIISNLKKEEREKYYSAAGNIIKEDFLNYSLQNPLDSENKVKVPNAQKMMIYMKTLDSKPKKEFVFDPDKMIYLGRDKGVSNIYLDEAVVSQNHCCIYSENMDVYLQDTNSSHGTIVKRTLLKKYLIKENCRIKLESGDVLIIGSNRFKVILFYYNMVTM